VPGKAKAGVDAELHRQPIHDEAVPSMMIALTIVGAAIGEWGYYVRASGVMP